MKILSVRAPWWWWIFHGKDIENRSWAWPPKYRGTVLIQASKWFGRQQVIDDTITAINMSLRSGQKISSPALHEMGAKCAHIVGRVDLVDVVTHSPSPWFVGPLGLVLANPVAFDKPIPFKAHLGLFTAPPEIVAAVNAMPAKEAA